MGDAAGVIGLVRDDLDQESSFARFGLVYDNGVFQPGPVELGHRGATVGSFAITDEDLGRLLTAQSDDQIRELISESSPREALH